MLFNSYIFIFVFLPIVLFGYYLLNRFSTNISNCFLVLMSLCFYGYFNYKYLLIIISSIIINFTISKLIINDKKNISKLLLVFGIAINLIIIFYFKYSNFFIETVNKIFDINIITKSILLPLGISFFTFQQISYIVDSYKGETENYTFLEYSMFVTFFPQLIAGPIVFHNELIPLFRNKNLRRFDIDNFSIGIIMFVIGLCKKVLIADNLNNLVSWLFNNIDKATCMDTIIGMIAYTFQIYFDFSGYCDMAQGIAKMFNFNLPVNFNSPYKSLSIIEFWKRWHISLTRFLTKYVYIPIGGNRNGKIVTYRNILITFFLSGLWHGANWTFIIWGILHGIFIIFTRIFENKYNKLHYVIKWLFTFIFLNFTWLLFRSNSLHEWMRLCGRIVNRTGGLSVSDALVGSFNQAKYLSSFWRLVLDNTFLTSNVIQIFIIFGILLFTCLFMKNNCNRKFKFSLLSALAISFLFVLCVISLSNVSVFLYFNF